MIPKIIHFVWVGYKPKSELIISCIDSWKKYCPDYEIKEWGNEEVAKIDNLYVRQAFENKQWAFVSDYLRLYALSMYGGFYCDTDLEITQNIDKFREYDFITGWQKKDNSIWPLTAFMGAVKYNKIVMDLLNEYNYIEFIRNGKMDQTTNVLRTADYFERKFEFSKPYDPFSTKIIEDNSVIFPSYFFCTPEEGMENCGIHHFDGSWVSNYTRKHISIGNVKVVRFKKRSTKYNNYLPLLSNEKIVFEMSFLKYKFCLVKNNSL